MTFVQNSKLDLPIKYNMDDIILELFSVDNGTNISKVDITLRNFTENLESRVLKEENNHLSQTQRLTVHNRDSI